MELTYKIYLKFISKFEEIHYELKNNEKGKKILNEVRSKKYYLNLHCLINAFWVLHCSFNLSFEKYIQKEGFDYFQHAIDRIKLYEKVSEKKEEEEEEEENSDDSDDDFSNEDEDNNSEDLSIKE